MICPFMTAQGRKWETSRLIQGDPVWKQTPKTMAAKCAQESCALWCEENGECSIRCMARNIEGLYEATNPNSGSGIAVRVI